MQLRIKDTASLTGLPPQLTNGSSNDFLKMAVTTLFRHKWLILTVFLGVLCCSVAYAVLTPSRYKSSMKFLVKTDRVDPAVSPEDHTWTDRMPVSEEKINSEIELLKSRDLLQQVAEKLQLGQRNEEPDAVGKLLGKKAEAKADAGLDSVIQALQGSIEINPIKKADIIEITYTDSTPEMTVSVLKELADSYLNKHLEMHQNPGAYDFFKTQASEYEQQLRSTQNELTGFRQKNAVTDLDTQKKLLLNYQADLEKNLLKTEADVVDAGKRVEVLKRQLNTLPERILTQSREIPNQFAIERFNTMLVELNNKRTQLLTKFHADDRLVQEVDAQIQETKIALEKAEKFKSQEKQTDPNPTRMALEPELHRTEAMLSGLMAQKEMQQKQLVEYRARLAQLEGATLKNNELERTLKQTEDNYKLYTKKEEEARIAKSLDQQKIANVAIAEAPTVPSTPYKPNRPLTVVLGAMIGMFISLSLAFMLEYFSETIHTTKDLETFTGLPVLATIPLTAEYRKKELALVHPVELIAPLNKAMNSENTSH